MMNESELREGLAKAICICDGKSESEWPMWVDMADAAIAVFRQHDDHAEFVRAVREIAERAVIRHGDGLGEASGTIAIIAALCNAELAKENPHD